MFQALGDVVARHDLGMMVAAIAVGMAAALCLFRLRSRMRHTRGMVRTAWILLAGAVCGVGGWGAEVTGLGAFHPGSLERGFEPTGVLGALIFGVLGASGGLALAWSSRDRLRTATGALVLTLSAAGMHFITFAAFRMPARIAWEPIVQWAAVSAMAAAFVAALLAAGSARRFSRQALGAALMGVGMLTLYLASLSGVAITPDASVPLPNLIAPGVTTFVAIIISVLTTLGGLGAAYIDDVTSQSALARTRRLADAAREGIVVLSERSGAIMDCNAAFCAMAGRPMAELLGLPLADLLASDDGGALDHGRTVEATLRAADGGSVPVEVHARPLHEKGDEAAATTVVALRDLREQRAAQDHIRFLAEHDPLTRLPNRALMNRALEARIAGGAMLTIVRVVNHAETNSLYGHAAGDAVLVKLAERLNRFATHPLPGYTCLAARLGGAEMALVVFGEADLEAAPAFTSALIKSLNRPVPLDAHVVEPRVRIGLSCAPIDARTVQELVRHAEVALEAAARDEVGDGVVYFRQDLQDELVAQRNLLHDLKVGLAEDQLVVFYQPQVRAADASLCGFEALVRWIHPTRGFMPPDSFIPAAEQSGLIIELGEQVLRRACQEAAGWAHPVPVAVNLSPLQVGQADLPRRVHQILMETGLPPSRLELEVTESALFRDFQRALDTLRRLKALGVRIAMDDFGTGFSSLSTLQSFPFDKIKIDKSFVNGAGALERSTVIVKAVLGIGKGLDIPVVAEGVETAEQMAFLRDEGCAVIQGYHVGKPARIEAHQALFDALDTQPTATRAPRVAKVVAAA